MTNDIKVFTGTSNKNLSDEICLSLGLPIGQASISRFNDGEVYVQILENVRGEDVFVIQSTCRPVDRSLMELLVMIDAFKRASARRITAVLPYFGNLKVGHFKEPFRLEALTSSKYITLKNTTLKSFYCRTHDSYPSLIIHIH